jgi:prepilin-type N-terminal cleavage/methylation domain-containing protein
MNKRMNRKGFTLAEVLIVVAILVVLASVGTVALVSHMRNMQKLEMDGQAKELFVAAQNHLSLAESQGYLGVAEFTGEGESATSTGNFGYADAEKGVYYIVVNNGSSIDAGGKADAILKQMLPFGSMDESARAGGSYIIRYQKDPAQVLDVFYVSTSGRYKLKNGDELGFIQANYTEDLKGYISNPNSLDLKNYKDGAVVGYYGGAAPLSLTEGVTLLAPTVEIINGEQLIIKVTDHNGSTNGGTNMMTLVFTDIAGKELSIPLKKSATNNLGQANYARLNGSAVVDGDDTEFTLIIDDVTSQKLHFAYDNTTDDISDFKGKDFTIGEDITVYAVAYNNSVLTNIAQSVPQDFNSLFASRSGSTAKIGCFRHLLNLDATVSGVATNPVTTAEQIANLDWNSFTLGGITDSDGSSLTASGKFYPVTPAASSFTYDGKDLSISDLVVDVSTRDAGLFADFSSGTIKDLVLKNFTVKNTGSGNAGALAGSFGGTLISGVLAYNTADATSLGVTSASGHAGGLVGKMTAGKVDKSAAAVYVSATGAGNAGGLIGLADGAVTVSNSYSGGHTEDAKYRNLTTASPSTSFNVQSASGNAGGLIGAAAGASLSVGTSYSTASAKAEAENTGAGGLIGNTSATTVTINNSYATGLALTGDKATTGAFVALSTSTITGEGNKFLSSLNASPSNLDSLGYTLAAATSSDAAFCLPTTPTDTRASAVPYDTALITGFGGKYSFPTIDQLNGITDSTASLKPGITDRHYGDWQMPTMEILNYTLTNSDTLFTDITFKENTRYVTMVLFGETSKAATAFLLQLSDSQSNATIVDTGVLSTDEREITWRGEPNEGVVQPGFNVDAEKKTLTITFDDITTAKGHFASIFPNLVPGENVTLFAAGGKCSWAELQTLRTKVYPDDMENPGEIIALSDNSLFAKPEALEAKEATKSYEPGEGGAASEYVTILTRSMSAYPAEIKNLRHLQNLDTSISNVNAELSSENKTAGKYIKTAKLMESFNLTTKQYDNVDAFVPDASDPNKFNWATKNVYVYNSSNKTDAGYFNGIYNEHLTVMDGNDKTIVGLKIGTTYGTQYGNAGLFRSAGTTLSIEHLRLANISIDTTGNGGAFVATVPSGSTVTLRGNLVLAAETDKKVKAGTAGGLVGASSGTLKIVNSAAAMYVSGSTAAGGLLGKQAAGTVEIRDSYVGGHTSGGEYSADLRNIVSLGGAAGGLIGETASGTTVAIRQSFNAASVYSRNDADTVDTNKAGGIIGVVGGGFSNAFSAIAEYKETSTGPVKYPAYTAITADSKILNLVYVVAPVNSVGSITGSAGTYTLTGGNGSVMGNVNADDLTGNGLYFLPDVYSDPLPVQLDDAGHSNIIPIGSGAATLSYAELEAILNAATAASSYERTGEGVDNAILGVAGSHAHLEQETTVFDESLSRFEYPFSIWTTFNFNGSALHYYGDWQRLPHVSNIHLHIHYVASLPKEDGSGRFNKQIDDEEIILQIPYTPTKFNLLYAPDPAEDEDYYDYQLSDSFWSMYQGNWSETTAWPATPVTTFDRGNSGGRETLKSDVFQVINDKSKYVKEDGTAYLNGDTGDPHLHITLVAKYELRQSTLHVLRFFDDKSPTNKVYDTEPTTFLVVTDVSTAASMTLSALLDGKEAELPAFTKSGYRLAGWYDKNGNRIYENYYDHKTDENPTGDEKFHLRLVSGNTEVAKDVLNIDLYAQYRPIQMRTIHIHFTTNDTTDHKVPNVDDWDILYEADRGFYPTIKLPNGNGLSPVSVTDGSGNAISDGSVTLDGAQLTFDIAGVTTTLTDAEKNISYTVTYQVTGTEPAGYVVLCEKQHTGSDGTVYNDSTSYIIPYLYTSDDDYVPGTFGATKPGEAPDPYNEAATPIPKDYITDCGISSDKFVPYGMKILSKDDDGNFVDSRGNVVIAAADVSKKNIPNSVYAVPLGESEADADNYAVTYVVLLQYSRKTYRLIVDTNGCKNLPIYYDPSVEYGRDLYSYLLDKNYYNDDEGYMERTGYAFSGWSYVGGATGDVETDKPFMPAENTTVTAQWLGTPAKFTVLFMTQEADDEDAYTVSGYDNAAELMANAGTGFEFSGSGLLSWLNDSDPADETIPPKSTKTYDESTVVGYLADDDPVKEIFKYFELNVEKTRSLNVDKDGNPIKVRDDGNTTYKIYFDRKIYTLRFDVVFSARDGWGYKQLTSQYEDNKVNTDYYGLINGEYVLLQKGADGNLYYYEKEKVSYPGTRFKTSNSSAGENKWGVVDGKLVKLTSSSSSYWKVANNTRYSAADNDKDNNPAKWGIFGTSNTIQRVYWKGFSGNKKWRQSDSNTGTVYNGKVFKQDNGGNRDEEYTGQVYHPNSNKDNGNFDTDGGSSATYGYKDGYYFEIIESSQMTWQYTDDNGQTQTYEGTVFYESGTSDSYTIGFIDNLTAKQVTVFREGSAWYYWGDDSTHRIEYTDPPYIEGATGSETLYLGTTTNAYNGSHSDSYYSFFSQKSNAVSFNTTGLKAYDIQDGGTAYTVYYLDLTARYGSSKTIDGGSFYDRWPAEYSSIGNYYFVGWIQSDRAKLAYDQMLEGNTRPSSLKGKYRTMSDILLLVDWTGTDWNKIYTQKYKGELSPEEEAEIYDSVSINEKAKYVVKSTGDKASYYTDGIAQEFHCRWGSGTSHAFTYEYWFEDPVTGGNADPTTGGFAQKTEVPNVRAQGSSGSGPADQTPTAFDGYQKGLRYYKNNNTWTEITGTPGYSGSSTSPMVIRFYYRLNRWKLVLHNEGWTNPTRTYDGNDKLRYGQSLVFIGTDPNLATGTTLTVGGKTKTFAGWYTTPDGVQGSEVDVATATMPDGVLNLYAVWRDAPSDVTFEQTPKYWNGTVTAYVPGTGLTLTWPKGKPTTNEDGEIKFTSVPNGKTLVQQGIEWDKFEPELTGWDFLYWGDSNGNPFTVDQPITAALTLYPYFEKAQATSATLYITYEWGGQGEQPADLALPEMESVTINFGENFSKTPQLKEGYRVDPPVVPPTFMTEARLHEDPFTYDEETKKYNLVFTYTEDEPEWEYTVGYYLRLVPYGVEGGTAVEIPLLIETDARTARGDFKFEQFYALPESLSGYEFQMLEFWQNNTHKTAYDTTDPTVLLKRGDGNIIKVFLTVDAKTVLSPMKSTIFNNAVQGFTKDDLTLPYLPTGEGSTITVNNPHCTYYSGVGTDGKPKVESPQDAGLYGVQVVVTVTYEGTEYEFWRSAPVVAGKKPAINYRIDRYTVILTSGSITNKFFNNDGNGKVTLPSGCTLAEVGYVARDISNPVITQSGSLVSQSNFNYSFSAESFRRTSSKHGTFDTNGNRDPNGTVIRDDFTPNVFSYQVSGLDLNNFSIYKVYGQLYIWDSVDDYNDWNG